MGDYDNIIKGFREAEQISDFDADSPAQNISGKKSIFEIRTANKVCEDAKSIPDPNYLFYPFWVETETVILYAPPNLGKSLLAVEIAQTVAVKGYKVIYFDFELSDKQFETRYKDKNEKGETYWFNFSNNFYRASLDVTQIDVENGFEDELLRNIEDCILTDGAKAIIIDNITYVCSDTEKTSNAANLMKKLKIIQKKYNVSILVLAHTPKRDKYRILSRNDLQGSSMLMNFFDAAFTIGETRKGQSLRYLKQIKARMGEFLYNEENVQICSLERVNGALWFKVVGTETEKQQVELSDADKELLYERAKRLIDSGKSLREVAELTKLSKSDLGRRFKK